MDNEIMHISSFCLFVLLEEQEEQTQKNVEY